MPGTEQCNARRLERAVGMQVMVQRAGGHAAQLAADRGDAAACVGHQVLGVAQAFGRHPARAAALAPPRARAAAMPSFTRWRMTLRSISAKAAWICRKARPMGVVVSKSAFSARKPMPR